MGKVNTLFFRAGLLIQELTLSMTEEELDKYSGALDDLTGVIVEISEEYEAMDKKVKADG